MKHKKSAAAQFLADNWIKIVPYAMLILIVVVMANLNANTLSLRYISNKFENSFTLILAAVGQTFVLITGGFDLSVGGVICITNCLSAVYMQNNPVSIFMWIGICLAVGLFVGIINGLAIEKTGLQPFIVTLATQSITMGVALLILKVNGGSSPEAFSDALMYRLGGFSLAMLLTLFIIIIWRYFKGTKTCMNIYAIGSNERNARLNGVNVLKTRVTAYAISGGFAAMAGLFRTAVIGSGSPTAGADFVMNSISGAVIGGTSLTGGVGGIVGSAVGAMVLRYIQDLLTFLSVSSYWTNLVQGAILIFAVALSAYGVIRKKRKEGIG